MELYRPGWQMFEGRANAGQGLVMAQSRRRSETNVAAAGESLIFANFALIFTLLPQWLPISALVFTHADGQNCGAQIWLANTRKRRCT